MGVKEILREIKESRIRAECPTCGCEFKLSESLVFDGLARFPLLAQERRQSLINDLKERKNRLLDREVSADTLAEKKAIDVGLGKILEKVLPAFPGFRIKSSDCRLLYEPIDMIVFEGISRRRVDSVTFLEIKRGHSQLNKHQRSGRDAVNQNKVKFEVVGP